MKCSHATVMVAQSFGAPLVPQRVPLPAPERGAALVRIAAAGVCGSDLDILDGRDPRISLPLVPGHEGVGWIVETGGPCRDIFGESLTPGDLIVWNRGISCGRCYECAVMRQPALCPNRRVYGINIPASEPPGLNGCYGSHIYLRPGTHLIKLPGDADAASVAPATCSGATAAHAVEQAEMSAGDVVVVIGPGPLGLFAAALAWEHGAGQVIVEGTRRSAARLALAEAFGCTTINVNETAPEQRVELVRELSHGRGANVVIDAAGTPDSIREAMMLVARGGTIVLPGVATPIGEVGIRFYEDVAAKNVTLRGTWVSDTGHLWKAVQVALSRRYGLERMVTRFPLAEANAALEALRRREVVKAVLIQERE
ncbi:MAG: alcohol dehydrogenase catalytic domain-containing protein [Armatimonadetes bacterium]|nr:alcohol dehydrogenase catalytic domain-containing protein [Armatimonadota bacterium]